MSTLTFMKEVIRANRSTGAVAPSSQRLAEAVTDMAQLPDAHVIVEYGPGSGVFTKAILHKKPEDAFFVALEVNEAFVKATKEACPTANVIHDSAENALKHLQKEGFDGCDVIVSGLPWSRFDAPLQDSILDATYDVLHPGGRFLTFGYTFSAWMPLGKRFFKEKLNEKFGRVTRSSIIWKNFPPCYIYIAEKTK